MPDEPDLPSVPPDLPSVPPHLPSAPPVVPSAAEPASQPATPPPTVREVLMAGCTRHDDQDRARGFAAGGELVQDDDHTIPFDQGGRTCECNLSPACKS